MICYASSWSAILRPCHLKMIRSSSFSFDESSIWDPKVIRQHLNIPEDQLIILSNIPEWSKGKVTGNTYRLEKDTTTENSQSSELHISNTTLQKSQEFNCQNKELFDKHFEIRRNILEAYKLNFGTFSKSTSLFEIDKINKNSSSVNHLARVSSVPNIYLFSNNVYSEKPSIEFDNRDSLPERHSSSPIKNKDLPIAKADKSSFIIVQTSTDISELKGSESKTYIEKSNMEVVSQLPIDIPGPVEKIRSNETHCEITTEKNALSASDTLQSSSNLSNSSVQPISLASANAVGNNINSDVNEKAAKLAVSEDPNSSEKNKCIIKESISGNCNTDENEKATKLAMAEGINSYEKNEINSCIVKETVVINNCNSDESEKATKLAESEGVNSCEKNEIDLMEVDTVVEDKSVDINVDGQKLSEVNETPDKCLASSGISKELPASKINLAPLNEPEKISDKSYDIDLKNAHKTVHQEVADNKLVTEVTLSIKRKLESKSRSSKKHRSTREKQSYLDERSIKKAGEICYSVDYIKSMLDIMKQFI